MIIKKNRVVNINLSGGLLALFQSPSTRLAELLTVQNSLGWNLIFVLRPNSNPLFLVLSLACLIMTLGIYMPLPSYMLILEKEYSE